MTRTVGSCRCTGASCLDIDGDRFDEPFEAAKKKAKVASDAEIPASVLKSIWSTTYKVVVADATGQPFPQEPARISSGGPSRRCSRSWNGARAVAYRVRERLPHSLGTAVNVQSMVFGNLNDDSGTGVGFTRDPATGAQGSYGDFLVNAQGEDVVAGIRNTLHAGRDEASCSPRSTTQLLAIFAKLETHYTGHVRHRVHHRETASCSCFRPGWASGPGRPPCAWRWT